MWTFNPFTGKLESSGITIQDEGADQGQVRTVNYVGALVTAGVSGDTATITVTSPAAADLFLAWLGV